MNKQQRPLPRPQSRPADLMTSGPQCIPACMPGMSIRPQPRPEGLGQSSTPGMYPGLGIKDETDKFGALGRSARREDPSEVVLHQTDSTTADAVRDAYAGRVREGSSIGAHYLIDKDGATSLTVPTDRVASHAIGHNQQSIGIENVGMAARLNGRGDLHAQIEALNLTPKLKARLLAMDEPELRRTMSDNGNAIYGDVTPEQKRANWNLLRTLAADFGLDMSEDIVSHEHIQAKTIGEGENIEEMVDAMVAWPDKIAALKAHIAEQESAGVDAAELERLRTLLAENEAAFAAVDVDKTLAENNALAGEDILGIPGAATAREGTREQFWGDFYGHMGRLDEVVG